MEEFTTGVHAVNETVKNMRSNENGKKKVETKFWTFLFLLEKPYPEIGGDGRVGEEGERERLRVSMDRKIAQEGLDWGEI